MIGVPTWEEVEEQARRFQESEGGGARGPIPKVHNLDSVRILRGVRVLPWGDREYLCPPVPWEEAAELYRAQLRIAAMHRDRVRRLEASGGDMTGMDFDAEEEALEDQTALLGRVVRVMGTLIRPKGLRERLRWRVGLWRNPFRNATAQEVVELLHFFSSSLTASRVNVSNPATFSRSRRG